MEDNWILSPSYDDPFSHWTPKKLVQVREDPLGKQQIYSFSHVSNKPLKLPTPSRLQHISLWGSCIRGWGVGKDSSKL